MLVHFRMPHRLSAICHERREEWRLLSSMPSAIWHRYTGMFCGENSNSNGVLTSFSQGVSVPRRRPSEVLARIRRDCRHVRFRRDGLCIGARPVPEIHPVEVFHTAQVSQQNAMKIIQIDAVEQSSLIAETLCVTSSTSAQAVPKRVAEMLLGSHVCLSDLNRGIVQLDPRKGSGRPLRQRWCSVEGLNPPHPTFLSRARILCHIYGDRSLCLLSPVNSQLFNQISVRGPSRMRRVITYQLRNGVLLGRNCAIQSSCIQALRRHEPRRIV
jgi:hypothetical protein